jgi:hypothetical protein
LIALGTAAMLALLGVAGVASVQQPALGGCVDPGPAATIVGAFDLPSGTSVVQTFPDLSKNPELAPGGPLSKGPLHVVAMKGEVSLPAYTMLTNSPGPTSYRDVICIVTSGGDPWYFTDAHLQSSYP